MSPQVPDELLMARELSLTYSAFRRLTRTLLFAHFNFHPFAIGAELDFTLLPPPDAELGTLMARLDFWTSPEIAPLIRSCNITPMITTRTQEGLRQIDKSL
ncbi:hypothetical protein C8R47DRAFT_1205839 [Mycena vitilis]|nr:hypothetical protein C8R47DRAFT_1205839 [Mycena vitilis]